MWDVSECFKKSFECGLVDVRRMAEFYCVLDLDKCVKRSDPRYTWGMLDVRTRLRRTGWRRMAMSVDVENEALPSGIDRCGYGVSVTYWCD